MCHKLGCNLVRKERFHKCMSKCKAFQPLFKRAIVTPWKMGLLCGWVGMVCLWCVCFGFDDLSKGDRNYWPQTSSSSDIRFARSKTETGPFCVTQFSDTCNTPPQFHLRFDNLAVEQSKAGLFKTGLCKSARIDQLQVKLHHRTPANTASRPVRSSSTRYLISGINLHDLRDATAVWQTVVYEMKHYGVVDCSLFIDVSNLVAVRVAGLDWALYRDGGLVFALTSKQAVLSHTAAEILLRGCVTVTTGSGDTLTSNHLTWNLEDGSLHVPGRYMLNRNGHLFQGTGIRCNQNLHVIGNKKDIRRSEA